MTTTPSQPQGASIRAYLDWWAEKSPDAPFLIDPVSGQSITYRQISQHARGIACFIDALGQPPGSTIAYAMTNSLETVATVLGIMYGGYQATAVNLVAGNSVIAYVLAHSAASCVFVQKGTASLIDEANPGIKQIVVNDTWLSQLTEQAPAYCPRKTDDALLMYTSGTTGKPKGVVLTQASLIAGSRNTVIAHQLTDKDRSYCVLPLYHINGLCVSILATLITGGSVVLPAKFSVSCFWQEIQQNVCTWFSVVPTLIAYLLHDKTPLTKASLAHVRFGRSASAPLSPEVHKAFEERFGIVMIETMGLTETAAQILANPLPPGTRKIGSPGIAFGNQVCIADDRQQLLPPNTEGELLVRGENLMRCYLNNPEATNETRTTDGWLRTGDLGSMDDDGYVFISGRLKELIIKGGENIAPREIDDALYQQHNVVEAAAFAYDHANYGQSVRAAVKLSDPEQFDEQALIELCVRAVGKFKAPDKIYLLDEIPKGPSGKIQRRKLAEMIN